MEKLSRQQFEDSLDDFDRVVTSTTGIDRFCSSSCWVVAASRGLLPGREPWYFRGDAGYFAVERRRVDGVSYLEPSEAMWGLSSPLVGAKMALLVDDVIQLLGEQAEQWHVLVISGLISNSASLACVADKLSRTFTVRTGPTTSRFVVDLSDSVDDFLGRRSRRFRKAISRARRQIDDAGISFDYLAPSTAEQAASVFARILDVEDRSWKGAAGIGIGEGPMADFYREMGPLLAERGRHRTLFARRDGRDVGYVLGGLFGDVYRGLQFSFDESLGALSLGNVMQVVKMNELVSEGIATYDLGSEADYKKRWADRIVQSPFLIVLNR